ncbi:hypothetical protein V490_00605 [Pseudogymnoascus sp. VKM F-3557]|nr:hypothetical protein V490_00605 [Pseudogymnoascus sp. VKM F-3557]
MALIKLGGLFLLAGVVSSMAIGGVAPTVALNEPKPCEYYGDCIEVELWGYRVQRLVNTSTAALQARAGGQTKLDVGKDRIRQETVSFQDDPAPPADFKALWDKILEACYEGTCDPAHTITVGAFSLNVDGQFPGTTQRNHFVDLLRAAFDKSVTTAVTHEVVQQPGPPGSGGGGGAILSNIRSTSGVHFLNANIFGGPNSGQHMTVHVTRSAVGNSCPGTLSTIGAAGALVPGLGEFFGLINMVCTAIAS